MRLESSQWISMGAIASNPSFQKGTFQGINISHLGKRNIIFKMPFLADMLVPWRVHLPMMVIFHVLCLFAGK